MKKISKFVTAVLVASLISGCGKETPAVEETAENVAVSEEIEETPEETAEIVAEETELPTEELEKTVEENNPYIIDGVDFKPYVNGTTNDIKWLVSMLPYDNLRWFIEEGERESLYVIGDGDVCELEDSKDYGFLLFAPKTIQDVTNNNNGAYSLIDVFDDNEYFGKTVLYFVPEGGQVDDIDITVTYDDGTEESIAVSLIKVNNTEMSENDNPYIFDGVDFEPYKNGIADLSYTMNKLPYDRLMWVIEKSDYKEVVAIIGNGDSFELEDSDLWYSFRLYSPQKIQDVITNKSIYPIGLYENNEYFGKTVMYDIVKGDEVGVLDLTIISEDGTEETIAITVTRAE